MTEVQRNNKPQATNSKQAPNFKVLNSKPANSRTLVIGIYLGFEACNLVLHLLGS